MKNKFMPHRAARSLVARFRRETDGVAAIEFAFIAPLLVVFLLGTTTATQSLWANGKISQASSVIGDLVSQESTFDNGSFETLLDAGPVLIEPFDPATLRIEVTAAIACHNDPSNITNSTPQMFVVWSNAWENGSLVQGPSNPNQPLPDAPTELTIEDSDYLIKTSVFYTHTPPISREANYSIDMEEIAYHQPRENRPVSYPQKEGNNQRTCDQHLGRLGKKAPPERGVFVRRVP